MMEEKVQDEVGDKTREVEKLKKVHLEQMPVKMASGYSLRKLHLLSVFLK